MRKVSVFLFVALVASTALHASFVYTTASDKIMDQILDLRFTEASELIAVEKKMDPENKLSLLFENYIDFLSNVIKEERTEYYRSQKMKSNRLTALQKDPDKNSQWYLHCQAEIEMQWAFVRLKFGEHLTAAKEINRAYKLFKENLTRFPDFLPSIKSFGLLKTLIGSLPEKYKWITELKGLEGSVAEGKADLLKVINTARKYLPHYSYLTKESVFYLSFLSMNLNMEESFADSLIELQKTIGYESPLIVYSSASLMIRTGKSADALKVLQERKFSPAAFPFHYLNYLQGLCLLFQSDSSCRRYFHLYIKKFKGQTFIRSAWNKLAWSYRIEGDSIRYNEYMQHVPTGGTNIVDEDKQATNEFTSNQLPNAVILRSRLYFDGGFYAQALRELLKIIPSRDLHKHAEQLEAIYRLARIQHKIGNTKDAKASYELTINLTLKGDTNYYAPNAALQLGIICESEGDKAGAIKYYKKCLSYNDHEYKQSLDQKAQSGLNRLR